MEVTIQNLCMWKNKASNKSDAFLNVTTFPFFQRLSMVKPEKDSVGTGSDCCQSSWIFVFPLYLATHV